MDELRAPVSGKDKFTTKAEALAKAKAIGCEGTHTMDEDGQTIYMPCSTHAAYDKLTNAPAMTTGSGYRNEPAPKEDQIEGSDKNAPGSAKGAGGDIKLGEQTETGLRNKVKAHNEEMAADNRPAHTRTTYGQLAAVYRRGSGAYSTSHRPGISRAAWSMARVNAFLYLLKNGKPKNAAYVTDNDLLPKGHPKSSRFYDEFETRDVDLTPPAYFRASARRGLEWVSQGHAGDGLLDRTKREARAMAEGNMTADKWVRLRAFLARHLVDFDAPAAKTTSDDYPSPGVVAVALWGGGGTRRSAERALEYATGVVDRLNAENEGRTKGATLSNLETRVLEFDLELREDGDEMSLVGYAALFNSRSENLGGFTEVIAPGAFGRSLKSRVDVKLLWNHDTSAVLGSTRSGTLELVEDERGLKVKAKLPNTTYGRDAKELIKRGDVTGFSFGFSMPGKGGDDWNAEGTERTLRAVKLHEVSLTPFPAYTATNGTASVRGLDKIAQRADVDADQLADALLKVEQGEEITTDDRNLLSKVIDTLSPVVEPEPTIVDDGMLKLKKLKADLLMKAI